MSDLASVSISYLLVERGGRISVRHGGNIGIPLTPLQDLLQEARELAARQDASKAQLRVDTKRRRALVPEGRAAASRLRAALKAHFGGHSERLVQYGIAPLRARRTLPPDPVPIPPEDAKPPAEFVEIAE